MNSIPKYQLSKNTIRQMVENISDGIETVIWDNYGYPNIMYVLNREAFQKHFDRKFYTTLDTTDLDVTRTTVVTADIISDAKLQIPQFPNTEYNITFELRDSSDTLKHTCVYGTDYIIENGLYFSWADKTTSSLYLSITAGDKLYYTYRHTLTPAAFTVRDTSSSYAGTGNVYAVKEIFDNIFISKYRAALTDGDIPVSLPAAMQDIIDLKDCEYRSSRNDYYLMPSSVNNKVTAKGDGWRPTNSIESGALKFLRSSTIFSNRYKKYTQNRRRLGGSPYFTSIPNLYDIYTSNITNNEHINIFKTEKKVFFNTDKNTNVKLGLRVPGVLDKIVNIGWTIRSDYASRYDISGAYVPLTVSSTDGSEWLASPAQNELANVFVPGQYLFDSSGTPVMTVIDYKEQLDCRINDLDSTTVVFTGTTVQGFLMLVEHDVYTEERKPIIKLTAAGAVYCPSIAFSTDYGTFLTYAGGIADGKTLILDCENETATIDGVSVLDDISGTWPSLNTGLRFTSFQYLDDPDSSHTCAVEISVPSGEDSKYFFQPYADSTERITAVYGIRCRLIAEPLSGFYNLFKEHPFFEEVRNSNTNPINKITDILNSDYTKRYNGIHSCLKKLDVYFHPANDAEPVVAELQPISVDFRREIDSTTEYGVPINVFLVNKPVSGFYENDFDYSLEYCSDSYSFFNEYSPGVVARKTISNPRSYVYPGGGEIDATSLVYPIRIFTLKNNTNGYNLVESTISGNANTFIASREFFDETTGNYLEYPYIRYISGDLKSNGTLERFIYAKTLMDSNSRNNLFPITIDSLTEGIYSVVNTKGAGWNVVVGLLENNFIFGVSQNWFSTSTDSTALPYIFQSATRVNAQEDIRNFSLGNPVYHPSLFKNYAAGARFRYRKFFPGEVYVSTDGETYVTRPLTVVRVDNSPLGYEYAPIGLDIYNTYIDTDLTTRLSDCLINSMDKYQNALIKQTDPHYNGLSGINVYEMVELDFSDPNNFITNNLDNNDIKFSTYYSTSEAYKFWTPLHECQGIVDIPPTKVAYRMTYLPGEIENVVVDEQIG